VIDAQAPLSPELVLVYPEARDQAIAQLPDFSWQTFVVRARAHADIPREEPLRRLVAREVRASVAEAVMLIPWGLAAFVFVTLVTLAFTALANATR
jgi:hypothetical protein